MKKKLKDYQLLKKMIKKIDFNNEQELILYNKLCISPKLDTCVNT